jgi:GTP cyclohydrolase III
MSNLQDQIEQERQQARQVCGLEGSTPEECAAAWDAVEELQAEAAHQKQNKKEQTSLEQYCSTNPDADECRVYED